VVEAAICRSTRGKAAGLDGLTAEHLQYSHPVLPLILTKLFNLMIKCGQVPVGFGLSYTIPLPKNSYTSKSSSVDDFRGISISPVVSKIFEKCVLDRYAHFFQTSDNQFGFKKGVSCSHAVYSVKSVVDFYTKSGTTVNLCAIDLKKAFDKMNHYGLFIKLMDRMLPVNLLATLEHWFSICATCVRWGQCVSDFIQLTCGVRQGGVLSPHLFAIYVDDIVKILWRANLGCCIRSVFVNIFLYADDIILLAPSVSSLQKLLYVVEHELSNLDMAMNASKSVCIRFGPRFNMECSEIVTRSGNVLHWADNIRYLGVYFVTGRQFKCSFDNNKKKFYQSFNAIYGKVGRLASEEVILNLLSVKCLPVLIYGLEACPVTVNDRRSLDFVISRTFMKIFRTSSIDIVKECQLMFNFRNASDLVLDRKRNFLLKYNTCNNFICQCLSFGS
jgi:hypothetical protein